MSVEGTHTKEIQEKKIQELHFDYQNFKSLVYFMEDEITFINNLLNAYVFEPNTPNLFERLQDYQCRLKEVILRKTKVKEKIIKHENSLGGMLQCDDDACDLSFYKKHAVLKDEITVLNGLFQNLKAEIFNYAGGILKKKKV